MTIPFTQLNRDFNIYYGLMVAYLLVITFNLFYSCQFSTIGHRIKLFLLLDNILVTMLAACISYVFVHLNTFCSVYVQSSSTLLDSLKLIDWQDYIIMLLYIFTNFCFAGVFRVLMVCLSWKPWQIKLYKLVATALSCLYIIAGMIYLMRNSTLAMTVSKYRYRDFGTSTQNLSNLNWNDSTAQQYIMDQFMNISII